MFSASLESVNNYDSLFCRSAKLGRFAPGLCVLQVQRVLRVRLLWGSNFAAALPLGETTKDLHRGNGVLAHGGGHSDT